MGNPYNGARKKNLRNWVDEFIPYYMEIMGVDRPDRTCSYNLIFALGLVSQKGDG